MQITSEKRPFSYPVGVAADAKGNIFVSDSVEGVVFLLQEDATLIRTIGEGVLKRPVGIALTSDQKGIYVVDALEASVLLFDTKGKLLQRFGSFGSKEGEFNRPTYITLDRSGAIYVVDSMNHRVQRFTPEGVFERSIGYLSRVIGGFGSPRGIAVDREGNIYVGDTLHNTVLIFDAQGRFLMHFGNFGSSAGEFALPMGLTMTDENELFIADTNNGRIQQFRRIQKASK